MRFVGRLGRVTPLAVHLATVVISFGLILYVGRRQWFYYDEWDFLTPKGPSLLTPHGGHLSILLDLQTHLLRHLFGLQTYWPYLACAVVAHVLLAHLLWRVMLRSRVDAWIATALALLFALFGTGTENILWEFQVGFMGAMCCGVAALLLVTRVHLRLVGCIGAAVVTAVGLATSGTSLPFLAAGIVLALRFRGLRTTIAIYVLPVGLYLLWYATKPKIADIATPTSLRQVLTFVPRYAGRMISGGFDLALPVPGIGAVLVGCLIAWLGARSARLGEREYALSAALLGSAVVFAALTGYSRFGIGIVAATSGRYVYFVFACCLPAIGAGATALTRRHLAPRAVVVLLVLAATAFNLGELVTQARAQATIEQGTRRHVYAALNYILRHPGQANPAAAVDSKWVHGLTPPGLLGLYQHGWIKVGHYGRHDELNALNDIAAVVRTAPPSAACAGASGGPRVSAVGADLRFKAAHSGYLTVRVLGTHDGQSRIRASFVSIGQQYVIVNRTGQRVSVASAPAGTTYCRA